MGEAPREAEEDLIVRRGGGAVEARKSAPHNAPDPCIIEWYLERERMDGAADPV